MPESQSEISSYPVKSQRGNRFSSLWIAAIPALVVLTGAAHAFVGQDGASSSDDKRSDTKKSATGNLSVENPFPDRIKAPSLDGGNGWLNTSGEITLKDLRGKVVLLDFWTFCCINCIHVLPDLKFLEKKYSKELVVIGVHSAKFDNEKDTENIRRAIMRYEIEHPVINDSKMTVWRKFGVRSWPTLVLLDPEGYYCGQISGEGHRDILDNVISRVITYHKAKGTLDETPVRFEMESAQLEPMPLKFPGKVLADQKSNRLFISDSNHNRIVITSLDGKLIDVVGSGEIGSRDGSYESAMFDHPQGMALVEETLYIADTENHLIRVVDLENKQVSTLAGTGQKARFRAPGGALRTTALNSPWALIPVDGVLYIAMAGPHQIWSHVLGTETVQVYAGSGKEDILNGSLQEAALAQPSSLSTDGEYLYVADSEGSAIRRVSLDPEGDVTTVVGPSDLPLGRSLFEFGDTDGIGGKARLQHPLGTAYHDGILYVADSYNHRIKKITLKENDSEVQSLFGDGQRGESISPLRFSEPSGLSVAGDQLFIADTNNHRILVANLKSGQVTALTIAGLNPPKPPQTTESEFAFSEDAAKVKPQTVTAGDTLKFKITLNLPKGYKLNKLAPISYRVKAAGRQNLIAAVQLNKRHRLNSSAGSNGTLTVPVPLAAQTGKATLELTVSYGYCRDGIGGLCKIKTARWRIPVEVTESADRDVIELE
ncbi:MAG: redoxin domain-containing protein, partial [Planctomycetes bacterium]|nr:redoxin domain-containing protein [Planctomycetota bacterium]